MYTAQTTTGQFLSAVAHGFVQTRLEDILFFLIVIAFVLVVVLALALPRLRERWGTSRRNLRRVTRGTGGAAAAPGERGQRAVGHQVAKAEEAPESTAELPEGSTVILAAGTGVRSRGRIVAQGPAVLLVKLDPGASSPARNSQVALFFHNAAGIFSFRTRIADVAGEAVHLDHSTQVSHFQRRKYYRRRVRLPVLVTRASSAASPRQAVLLDLGGGGASLQNPEGLFREGDALRMWFSPDSERLAVAGTVVRISKNGGFIHVRFESLSEAGRNRILAFLFRQPERRDIRSPLTTHEAASGH